MTNDKTAYRRRRSWREARRAYIILIPFFAYIALWNLYPLLYGLYLGLTEYTALGHKPVWVGLKNFRTFFATADYLKLLYQQIRLGVVVLLAGITISFIFALLLNVKNRLRGIFRVFVYIPSVAAITATTAVFNALITPMPDEGVNKLLKLLGRQPVVWNYSEFWMYFWIVVYSVWRGIGPTVLIWLGGLQAIDVSLYEAARVDGAGFWQQVRFITIPGLRFVSLYILLTGIIGAMQMFDVVMFISQGGPFGTTDVLMYRIYRDGIVNFNLGMAGAESFILGVFTVLIALVYLWVQQRRVED